MILFVLISQDVQVQFRYIRMHIIYVPKCNTPWEMSKDVYHNPTSERYINHNDSIYNKANEKTLVLCRENG